VHVYNYFELNRQDMSKSVWRNGTANIDGVQFVDGGQLDSEMGALVFKDALDESHTSKVIDSSFMNCKSFCTYISNSQGIVLDDNVYFNAWVFAVKVEEDTTLTQFSFTNNLIIGVTNRPTVG